MADDAMISRQSGRMPNEIPGSGEPDCGEYLRELSSLSQSAALKPNRQLQQVLDDLYEVVDNQFWDQLRILENHADDTAYNVIRDYLLEMNQQEFIKHLTILYCRHKAQGC